MIGMDPSARIRSGFVFALLSAMLALAVQTVVGEAAVAANPKRCVQQSYGVSAHFLTHYENFETAISGVALKGFERASCDGEPVVIVLSGNAAGDPTMAATEQLSVLDSSLDPCSNNAAVPPVVISGGRIVLHGCPTKHSPSSAAYVDVHDLTRLSVRVAGHHIPIEGTPDFKPPTTEELDPEPDEPRPSGTEPTSTGTDAGGGEPEVMGVQQMAPPSGGVVAAHADGAIPDTGGPNSIILWSGALLLLMGVASLLWDLCGPAEKPSPSQTS